MANRVKPIPEGHRTVAPYLPFLELQHAGRILDGQPNSRSSAASTPFQAFSGPEDGVR
jgi:hypothetical protein